MIEIKNLMFQPLSLHLAGSGDGLHLKPRERRKIGKEEISPEIEMAEKRGFISMGREPGEDTSGEPESAGDGDKKPAKSKTKKTATRKKGR